MHSSFFISLIAINFYLPANAAPTNSYLREGDIRVDALVESMGENVAKKKWPSGIVPYVIASTYTSSEKAIILDGMNLITTKTGGCITFVPRNASNPAQNIWLSIKSLDGCWSYVGRNYNSGEQEVSLQSKGCLYTGTVVHELCHAIGFWHEQNRADRDTYVTVNFSNIDPANSHNFNKYTHGDYFGTPYDYYSIMHYDEYAFSVNGQKTIIPKQAGVDLIPSYDKTYAQILSDYDVQAIRASYSCSNQPVVTTTTTKAPVTTCTHSRN